MEQPLLVQPLPQQPKTAITTLYYRPLQPDDFAAVKAAHAALFPIDYDDGFFHKATNGVDRIWSCAAFVIGSFGEEQLAGFITAKKVHLFECDTTDRQHMQLLSPVLDHDHAFYILTLGVLEAYRHQGVASHLINSVCQHAYDSRCRAVFLHVITYNTAAMALYMRAGFQCMARLSNFYHIATGRQPDPATVVYDAYLYVQFMGAPGGLVSPWDMITIAWTPLRSAMGRIRSCMPQLRRSYLMSVRAAAWRNKPSEGLQLMLSQLTAAGSGAGVDSTAAAIPRWYLLQRLGPANRELQQVLDGSLRQQQHQGSVGYSAACWDIIRSSGIAAEPAALRREVEEDEPCPICYEPLSSVTLPWLGVVQPPDRHIAAGADVPICPVVGIRYRCLSCASLDLCHSCFMAGHHLHHSFARRTRPTSPETLASRSMQLGPLCGTPMAAPIASPVATAAAGDTNSWDDLQLTGFAALQQRRSQGQASSDDHIV
eukprot:gene8011-8209_t